ncbi:retropepsin-like aspartic protease [Flavicella marina]|uniref:retropepsin-like aspartic protease n=1 Tax=Flavicella marina TaxID=1475951 RepID=UPI0012652178|nr:retropepsin-like aspartic protease [Flavicella marina]
MASLKKSLVKKGYVQIPVKITKTNHMVVKVKLNGVKGRFILDTGASNSCVGFDQVAQFLIETSESEVKAAGAGAVGMETRNSQDNTLKMAGWKTKKCNLVIFDMSHVNEALIAHGAKPINGIIGADILRSGKAIIDYKNDCFYLK